MNTKGLWKKGISLLMGMAMIFTGAKFGTVGGTQMVRAISDEPSVTMFATPEQLMDGDNFTLTGTGSGVAQKVYFGANGSTKLEWYIVGKDTALNTDNIVLFATTGDYGSSQFNVVDNPNSNSNLNQYSGSILENEVANLEYGGEKARFTAAEDALMLSTNLSDNPASSAVKLYVLNAHGMSSTTAGATDSLMIANQYWYSEQFWLRTSSEHSMAPYPNAALVAVRDAPTLGYAQIGDMPCWIIPAFALDLSKVLFASAASTSTDSACFEDVMTFRLDGSSKIASTVTSMEDAITVTKSDKDSNLYLYVQGTDSNFPDWVYSTEITASTVVTATDVISLKNLGDIDLTKCKIWLETTDANANLTYAKMEGQSSPAGRPISGSKASDSKGEEGKEASAAACKHTYEWQTISEATEEEEGIEAEVCSRCGSTIHEQKIPNSALSRFLNASIEKIQAASAGSTVEIKSNLWFCFNSKILDAIAEKNAKQEPVNVQISYIYQHKPYTVTIPAGYDVQSLADDNGYCGFMYLLSIFGETKNEAG